MKNPAELVLNRTYYRLPEFNEPQVLQARPQLDDFLQQALTYVWSRTSTTQLARHALFCTVSLLCHTSTAQAAAWCMLMSMDSVHNT